MHRILYALIIVYIISGCSPTYQSVIDDSKVEAYPFSEITDTIEYVFLKQLSVDSNRCVSGFHNLKEFYLHNNYHPLWINDSLIGQGVALINKAKTHGLIPGHYNKHLVDSLNTTRLSDSLNKIYSLALLDIAITDGLLKLSRHLVHGKLKPQDYHAAWNYPKRVLNKNE